MDETHDPALTSWVDSANSPGSDFPIQNLPFGVFRRKGTSSRAIGIAIGDLILDLHVCGELGFLDGLPPSLRLACSAPLLNELMALGREASATVRLVVSRLLRQDAPVRPGPALTPARDVEMLMPAEIGDYTDFYASVHHASNVGRMFRPDHPLLPNYKYVPIAYHGRSSSIIVSGTPVRRPEGQLKPPQGPPVFRPATMLDYEAEIGVFIGAGNALGDPVGIEDAEEHLFGFCLLNDWSARDIQAWEYQPLGPFLAKNFATSISPWVVTVDALEPFRAPLERSAEDPSQMSYLHSDSNDSAGAVAITIETWLRTEWMRTDNIPAERVSAADFASLFWTPAQMIAHHTSGGCNLRPGDLLGSGTVSGPSADAMGCLLEITERGTKPLILSDGEERRFLDDGDEVILRAYCEREGFRRIGFGECRGVIIRNATS
jgi:fumarylacetoacetase